MLPRLLAVWFSLACLAALAHPFARAPFAVPLTVFGLALAMLVVYRQSPRLRAEVDALDLRVVVLAHAVRAPIGVAFLFEASRGALSSRFAGVAGPGDIAAGLGAIAVALFFPTRRLVILAWNALALLDILVVIATANSLTLAHHDALMLSAFSRAPYALLPLVVVPLVLATHALVFVRLRRKLGFAP